MVDVFAEAIWAGVVGAAAARPLAVSPAAAARLLGCSRDFFDRYVLAELRVVRRGRRILIATAELEQWLQQAARMSLADELGSR